MGFRDKIKNMKKDLVKTTQERINRGEDTPEYGSIFIKENIPDGVGFWRPGTGEHLFDVIPWQSCGADPRYIKDQWVDIVDVWVHQNVGSMYDQFVCQVRAFKEPDPMCEYTRMKRPPKEEYKLIAPKRRCVFLVWVHDSPEEEAKGIQIWEVAHYNSYRHIDKIAKNPRGGDPTPYSDVIDGKSIAFEIVKSGTYKASDGSDRDSLDFAGFRFVDRESEIPDEFGDLIFPLDNCIKYRPTWDEQMKAFPMSDALLLAPDQKPKEASEEKQSDDSISEEEEPPKTKRNLVLGYVCEECRGKVYDTPSGRVCEEGHEGIEGEPLGSGQEDADKCPAPDGTFGVHTDKLPECNKCDIWDECADAGDKRKVASKPKEEPKKKEEAPKKITRRRRRG